jgi:hypothetical protein
MAKIRAKEPQILSAQVQIARKSLAEWPNWLKESPKQSAGTQQIVASRPQRLRPAPKR